MGEGVSGLRRRGLIASLGIAFALAVLVVGAFGGSGAQAAAAPRVDLKGSVSLGSLGNAPVVAPTRAANDTRPRAQEVDKDIDRSTPTKSKKNKAPSALPSSVVSTNPGFTGFNGLNHFDQRTAGSGAFVNSQFSNEPPDQGLCIGNGFVLESVNTAIRVDDTSGTSLTPAVPINQFLGLAPEVDRNGSGAFGDFTSDPKCYYDTSTQRWFFTVLQLGVDPTTGDFDGTSKVFIAVSATNDPTDGWNIYAIDTTNDFGSACPCLGDQPLIGADQNGFYVSTNSFPIFTSGFNGAVIYAISKSQLVAGAPSPTLVEMDVPNLAEGQAYSIQPATTPTGVYDTSFGGTEYFLSALDFNGSGDTRIAAWMITNTSSLDSTPALKLSNSIVATEKYTPPPVATQKDGDTPLRDCLNDDTCATNVFGGTDPFAPNPLNPLNTNDDRMNQVVFAHGTLWGGVNTGVRQADGTVRSGIAYFAVTAAPKKPAKLKASLAAQGYISVDGANVFFPSIGVNDAGDAVMAYTLSGTAYFPSAAYSILKSHAQAVTNPPDVHLAQPGAGPADGFTGYQALDDVDQGVERWGDYSAAVAAADGTVWFATEYIGQTCTLSDWLTDSTCGNTRSFYANWGTFIGNVTP
jgi:hypothetical protein